MASNGRPDNKMGKAPGVSGKSGPRRDVAIPPTPRPRRDVAVPPKPRNTALADAVTGSLGPKPRTLMSKLIGGI